MPFLPLLQKGFCVFFIRINQKVLLRGPFLDLCLRTGRVLGVKSHRRIRNCLSLKFHTLCQSTFSLQQFLKITLKCPSQFMVPVSSAPNFGQDSEFAGLPRLQHDNFPYKLISIKYFIFSVCPAFSCKARKTTCKFFTCQN